MRRKTKKKISKRLLDHTIIIKDPKGLYQSALDNTHGHSSWRELFKVLESLYNFGLFNNRVRRIIKWIIPAKNSRSHKEVRLLPDGSLIITSIKKFAPVIIEGKSIPFFVVVRKFESDIPQNCPYKYSEMDEDVYFKEGNVA